jgi:hypothetical protein
VGIDPLVQLSKVDGEFEIIAGSARLLTLRRKSPATAGSAP